MREVRHKQRALQSDPIWFEDDEINSSTTEPTLNS